MPKQRIDIIAGHDTYKNLTTFESVEALNVAVRTYKDTINRLQLRKDVTRNMLRLLDYIKRHSCRYFGVSWKGKRKVAAELCLSDKTVTRLCQRLESLGIIKQYEMKRASNHNQTSNAIVIIPVVVEGNVGQADEEMSHHENNTSLKQTTKILNKRNESVQEFDSSFVSSSVPFEFVAGVSPYFANAKDIYHMWGRLKLSARKSGLETNFEDYMTVWIKTFKETLYTYKNMPINTSLHGYLYGAWRNAMTRVARQLNAKNLCHWLEA